MKARIIERSEWPDSSMGNYFASLEQNWYDTQVNNAFGYHALQLGAPWLQTLRCSRVQRHWLLDQTLAHENKTDPTNATNTTPSNFLRSNQSIKPHLQACFDALPLEERSTDVLTCPHTLEMSQNPHQALREMHRVLIPEGKLFLTMFNPHSFWGLAQRRSLLYTRWGLGTPLLPGSRCGKLSVRRLRDWLRLLGFEIESVSFCAYRPAFRSESALQKNAFFETFGARYWPFFGAVYAIEAIKRQYTIHPSGLARKKARAKKPFLRPVATPNASQRKP